MDLRVDGVRLAQCERLSPAARVFGRCSGKQLGARAGAAPTTRFALLRSAGTAATAREARQQRTLVGRGGVQ